MQAVNQGLFGLSMDGIKPHISPRPERFNRRESSTTVQMMTSLGLYWQMWKSDVRSNPHAGSFFFFDTNIIYAGKAL